MLPQFSRLQTALRALVVVFSSALIASAATPGVRIDAGDNTAHTDSSGNVWAPDANFAGGVVPAQSGNAIDMSAVTNPAPLATYQTERYGAFTYTVPGLTAGSAYTVRLHFAEVYFNAANLRKFNVSINGTPVLADFDIFAAAGGMNKAVAQQFIVTANAAGQMVIQFTAGSANNPKVCGIEVLGSITPINANGVSINCGDGAVGTYIADTYFVGGNIANHPNPVSTAGLIDPAPQAVYQTERWGACTYSIPFLNANTAYKVRLHFAETWFTGAAGQGAAGLGLRQFNVAINGTAVLTNFDVTAAAGSANKAVIREFTATSNAAGQIVIQFVAGAKDNPEVNGIQIVPIVGPQAPTITSPGSATGQVGVPFTYQIAATNSPASYSASPLPSGLTVNAATGLISGIPTTAGITATMIGATNAAGTGSANLTITILAAPQPPVITSPTTASGTVGTPFTYLIAATNSPTSFSALGLPAGLTVNTVTGLISGTPTVAGPSSVTLGATNAAGMGNAILNLSIGTQPAPVITSPLTANGQVGSPISYQIAATNGPTSFGATGLPVGVTVNTATGLISGTPTVPGPYSVNLTATNAGGPGTATLNLTINSGISAIAINCGGPAITPFVADVDFVGGAIANHPNPIDLSGASIPAPAAVYQTERYGDSTYTIPGLSPNSPYIVRLHFAETYFTTAGQRQFTVKINGNTVLTNFDIVVAAGGANKAIVKEFDSTSSAAGTDVIQFIAGAANNAKIDGIELVAGQLPPPVLTSIVLTPGPATVLVNQTVQFNAVAKDQNGNTMSFPTPPTWTAGGGTISTGGLYTAGATTGTFPVTVTSGAVSANTTVTVTTHPIGPVSQYGWLKTVGGHLCDQNGQPIQLKGMSAHQLQFYPFTTSTVTNLVQEYHTTLVRAAMYLHENGYLDGATNQAIMKAQELLVIDSAIANDIYVLCDWHGVGGNPMDNVNEAKAFFQEMSARYAAYPNVIYELYNEPTVDWGTIKNYATQVIPVIRANSPNSIIVVGTPNFSSSVGDVANNRINLPNIMYTMHFYCGNATNEADNPGARTNVSNLMAQGVAVFVTEWGCSNYTGDGGPYPNTANNYLNWMATEKISWANWSLTTKAEGSAFLKPSATMSGPWTDADLSADGLFMKNKF